MFGLGEKVSLDMFEESAGLMPSQAWKRATRRQPWFPGETVILGIGQGYMQVTPLQLAQATALIANKGVWNRPHLARTVDGVAPVDEHPMPNILLKDPRDWEQVNHGMQMVMHDARGLPERPRRALSTALPARVVPRKLSRSSKASATTGRKPWSATATMPCSSASPRPSIRRLSFR